MSSQYTRLTPLDGSDGVAAAAVVKGNQVGLALVVNTGAARYAIGIDTGQAADLAASLTGMLAAGPEELMRAVTDRRFRTIIEEDQHDQQ